MADDDDSEVLYWLFGTALSYMCALILTSGGVALGQEWSHIRWWQFLLAVPLTPIFLLVYRYVLTPFFVLTLGAALWLFTHLGGPAVTLYVAYLAILATTTENLSPLWISASGIGFLVFGAFCGHQAAKNGSRPMALTGLSGLLAGVVLIPWGVIALIVN